MAKDKFERTKPHVNVGTIGHVDHGKTTLDCRDHHHLAKKFGGAAKEIRRDDSSPEEKARGITIQHRARRVRDRQASLRQLTARVTPTTSRT